MKSNAEKKGKLKAREDAAMAMSAVAEAEAAVLATEGTMRR